MGPSACCSSPRPMHWPELPPVHGMLSTSGSPPGEVWLNTGELGTRSGVQLPVKASSDSPFGHAEIVGAELVGTATTSTAGAAATATANPPASISRPVRSFKVAIVVLSVVVSGSGISHCRCAPSNLCCQADYAELPGGAVRSRMGWTGGPLLWISCVRTGTASRTLPGAP